MDGLTRSSEGRSDEITKTPHLLLHNKCHKIVNINYIFPYKKVNYMQVNTNDSEHNTICSNLLITAIEH